MLGPEIGSRYGEICTALRSRGIRLGMLELNTAAEIATEEASPSPDREKIRRLLDQLGLTASGCRAELDPVDVEPKKGRR